MSLIQNNLQMATELAGQERLLAEQKIENKDDITFFEKVYREVGMRVRVDELIFIDTAAQKYGIRMVLDRTWEASERDLKQWKELKTSGKTKDYDPEYVPYINVMNEVVRNTSNALPWEQTGGNFIIQYSKQHEKYYNRYKIETNCELTEEFEVQNYPFDIQDLSIVIGAETASIKEQRLVPHHISTPFFTINVTYSSITDWDVIGIYCKECIVDTDNYYRNKPKLDTHFYESWVNFKIQVKRKWEGILKRVCIWMFLLGILSFCIFSHSYDETGDRLAFGITMVLTIVAFQFVITSSLPQVNYLTLIDYYNLFIFGTNVLFMVESALINVAIFDHETAQIVDSWCMTIFAISFVVGHIGFGIISYVREQQEREKEGFPSGSFDIEFLAQNTKIHEFADKKRIDFGNE
eukprot:251964_1